MNSVSAYILGAAMTVAWCAVALALFGVVQSFRRRMFSTFLLEFLGTLAKLGLPLTRAVGSSAMGLLPRSSQRDLEEVEWKLEKGMLLGDALAPSPHERGALREHFLTFQPYPSVSLVSPVEAETLRIGEMSGNLPRAFELVVRERRRFEEIRTWITTAFLYPAAVLLVVASVLSFLMAYIVPKFARTFKELETEFPPMTRALGGPSGYDLFVPLVLVLLIVLAVAGYAIVLQIKRLRAPTRRRTRLREVAQRVAHFIPFRLGVMRRALLAEFCTELAMLLRAGTPPHRALTVLAQGTMNPWFRDRIAQAAERCEKGEDLAAALEKSGLDPRAAWFSRAAQDPAELADSLGRLADDYRARVMLGVAVAGRLLPPVMILCAGAIVGFVVISMFLPLVKLAAAITAW